MYNFIDDKNKGHTGKSGTGTLVGAQWDPTKTGKPGPQWDSEKTQKEGHVEESKIGKASPNVTLEKLLQLQVYFYSKPQTKP